MSIIIFVSVLILDCNNIDQKSISEDKMLSKTYTVEQIAFLDEILSYYDSTIICLTNIKNVDLAYHSFCESLDSDLEKMYKQLEVINSPKFLKNKGLMDHPFFHEIWKVEKMVDIEAVKGYERFELNHKGGVIKILKLLKKRNKVFKKYLDIFLTSGGIPPSLAGGFHHVHNKFDFNDCKVRLWFAIHFTTIEFDVAYRKLIMSLPD